MVDESIIDFKLDSRGNNILKYVKNFEIFKNSAKIKLEIKITYYDYKH